MEGSAPRRRLRLRYPAVCSVCELQLSPGTGAFWDRAAGKATCLGCDGTLVHEAQVGNAGSSALAKAEEFEEKVVRSARRKWGDHAAAVAAKIAQDEPSIRTWAKGGDGERRLAAFIGSEVGDAAITLHDRLIPGTRNANIDHLFVTANGVWVVDAKSYKGKVEKRDVGPFWREEIEIYVGGRNRTKLVDGLALQVKAVRAALEPDPAYSRLKVRAALCFVDSDWALLARPFDVRGVTVLYPGALRNQLKRRGDLTRPAMERIANRLALSLPAAVTARAS